MDLSRHMTRAVIIVFCTTSFGFLGPLVSATCFLMAFSIDASSPLATARYGNE
jgi:hypothetical protein